MFEKRLVTTTVFNILSLLVLVVCLFAFPGHSDSLKLSAVELTDDGSGDGISDLKHQVLGSYDENRMISTAKKVFRWFRSYVVHIFILVISVGVIIFTLISFSNKLDRRRFLTTTRLSILHKQVQKACRYIETNYSDKELSVKKVCDELVTGAAFLEALFQKDLGIGVEDFIDQVRVNSVKNALSADPAGSDEMICEQSGFSNREELQRAFKKITDVSIDDYAENMRSKMSSPQI